MKTLRRNKKFFLRLARASKKGQRTAATYEDWVEESRCRSAFEAIARGLSMSRRRRKYKEN